MTHISTFFMMLRATRHWHELSPGMQRELLDDTLSHVFNRYPDLRMTRYAVAEGQARCTDLVVWETSEPAQYREAIESLRQEAFFGAPLFEIVEVITGAADGTGHDDRAGAPMAMLAL